MATVCFWEWFVRTVMENPDIDIRLHTYADKEQILSENPDVVLLGVGARPIIPRFSVSETSKAAWVGDMEMNRVNVVPETYLVGDCAVGGGTLANAVKMGFSIAMEI